MVVSSIHHTRRTPNGWVSFNAPCCHHRGHNPDTRRRGGLKIEDGAISYSCFNCKFKTGYRVGGVLGLKFRKLMGWVGISDVEISAAAIQALRSRQELNSNEAKEVTVIPVGLPNDAVLLDPAIHSEHASYLLSERGLDTNSYAYFISQERKLADRIIIPYIYQGNIVGYSARTIKKDIPHGYPKYVRRIEMPFVFGQEMQLESYSWVPLVEGEFDAISIGGCAISGNEVSEEQADQLIALKKEILVVPDMDRSGSELIQAAIDYEWSVSFPEWPTAIKDVNEAVKHYGRLFVTRHILQTKVSGALNIRLRQKLFRER